MPAARYWRLTFARTQGNQYAQIRELAFLDAAGVDQSIGGTAYASSSYSSSWLPAGAFDKNTSSGGWCNAANQFPASIWYAHPAPVDIAGIRIHFDPEIKYAPLALADMQVAWSDDGTTWQLDSRMLQIAEGGIVANTSCTMLLVTYQPPQTVGRGLIVFARAPMPGGPVVAVAQPTASVARDTEFGGAGRIWGTTKVKGASNVPTKARVRLLRDHDALLVREVWSDAETGEFEFTGIDTSQPFTVLATDAAGNFRAVAANRLLSTP